MKIIKSIEELKLEINSLKKLDKTIGFVPTMGFLHEGHVSLMKESTKHNDVTVVSIFVNPTQFGKNEDFDKYPKDLERDARIAEESMVDIIFTPSTKEMYPEKYSTFVDVEGITEGLCGKTRPGHFRGVATVVTKLFNIVQPDVAYFGQKDAQQVAVIKRMALDLNMNIKIASCPIIRENDGLAMSSRNVYLSKEERDAVLILSKTLFATEKKIKEGEIRTENLISYIRSEIEKEKIAELEYAKIVDANTLEEASLLNKENLIAIAAKFGSTRLIDNIIIKT